MSKTTFIIERPSRIAWPPLLLIGTVFGAILSDYLYPISWPGLNDWPARVVGFGFGIAGLVLIVWAIYTLVRAETNVMPHKGADKLVVSGPFSRFRNPIYLGDALVMLGVAEVTHNLWFVAMAGLFAVLVTWLAILPEERHLEEKFGDSYRDYKAKTRRWL